MSARPRASTSTDWSAEHDRHAAAHCPDRAARGGGRLPADPRGAGGGNAQSHRQPDRLCRRHPACRLERGRTSLLCGRLCRARLDRRLGHPVHRGGLSARRHLFDRLHAAVARGCPTVGLLRAVRRLCAHHPARRGDEQCWALLDCHRADHAGQHLPGRFRARAREHRGSLEIHHHRLGRHQPRPARHRVVLLVRQLRARARPTT